MKYLQELVRIVTRKKIQKVDILEESTFKDENSLFGKYYNGIANGDYNTDEDAAFDLYQNHPKNSAYRQLKSRFNRKLINNIFYLDANDTSFSEYHKAYYNAHKNYALCRIFLSNGARNNFEKLAKTTLALCLKYDFSRLSVLLLKDLISHYIVSRNARRFTESSKLLRSELATLNQTIKIEQIYYNIAYHFLAKTPKPEVLTDELKQEVSESIETAKRTSHFSIKYFSFLTEYHYALIQRDHHKIIEICERAEDYFENHPIIKPNVRLSIFLMIKMEAYLNIRDYNNSIGSYGKTLRYFREGTNNWMIFNETYFRLLMHTENYYKALEIFVKVTHDKRFSNQPEITQEKWKINEAYLHYILQSEGHIMEETEAMGLRNFRLMRFMNEVPTFSKDKAGANTAIVILQIIWLLMNKRFDAIIDRSEPLRIYRFRYLDKNEHKRENYFTKMLILLEGRSFKYPRVKRATENLFKEISKRENNIYSEWEILPYELLWTQVLNYIRD